jgi:hypothetical protein
MVETKPIILVEVKPGFGRSKFTARGATWMVARPHWRVSGVVKKRIQ